MLRCFAKGDEGKQDVLAPSALIKEVDKCLQNLQTLAITIIWWVAVLGIERFPPHWAGSKLQKSTTASQNLLLFPTTTSEAMLSQATWFNFLSSNVLSLSYFSKCKSKELPLRIWIVVGLVYRAPSHNSNKGAAKLSILWRIQGLQNTLTNF